MSVHPRAQLHIALAASALLHALLLAGLPGFVPPVDPPAVILEARLSAPPPLPVVPSPKPPPARPAVRTSAPAVPAAPPAPEQLSAAPSPVVVNAPAGADEEPSELQEAPQPEPAPVAQAPAADPPSEAPAKTAPEPAPEPAPPARKLPRRMTITYDLFLGTDRFSIGRTLLRWEADGTRYRISSQSETTGVAGFFRPYQLSYSSEGSLVATGLRPDRFTVRRGRSGERQAEAAFDWAAMTLAFGLPGELRRAPLVPGTLDVISLFYQLALTDLAPGRVRLTITNASRVELYDLEVGPSEAVETALGTMSAWPVRQRRAPGQESMEIWFAPQVHQLPVRIRFLDRAGNMSGEQIAREIQVDGD